MPDAPTWNAYAAGLPHDLPDEAYYGARDSFFNQNILPQAAQAGYDTEAARQQFMKQTERPDKAWMPRTSVVAHQAVESLFSPIVGENAAAQLHRETERANAEATKQGVNKPLPIIGPPANFAGQALGMAPYFALGEGLANPVLEAAGASKFIAGLGPVKEALHAATIGSIQGAYDAASAQEGQKLQAFGKGMVAGTALGGGFELLGGLAGFLRKSHGLTQEEANGVAAVAKGNPTEEQVATATGVTLKQPEVAETVGAATATSSQAASKLGIPKDTNVDIVNSTVKSDLINRNVKVNMLGADGKPYILGGAKGLYASDVDFNLKLISEHLANGGQIVSLGGSRKTIQYFLQRVEKSTVPDEYKLPIRSLTKDKPAVPETVGVKTEVPSKDTKTDVARASIHDIINSRDSLYHATFPEHLESILDNGIQLNPEGTNEDFLDTGVSTSRAPNLAAVYQDMPTTLVIKQQPGKPINWFGQGPNEHFDQYEHNTNGPVSASDIKGVLVNKTSRHWKGWQEEWGDEPQGFSRPTFEQTIDLLKRKDIPYKVFENQKEMQQYRAGLSKQPANMRWASSAVSMAEVPDYDHFMQLSSGEVLDKRTGEIRGNYTEKQTPIGKRIVGEYPGVSEDTPGLSYDTTRIYHPSADRATIVHEKYHGLTSGLDMHEDVMNHMDDPTTEQLFRGAFDPEVQSFYGNDPFIYREEVYAHSMDAIRTNDQAKIQNFIEADTDEPTFYKWFSEKTKAQLDTAAEKPDSIYKRQHERLLNDVQNRATRHLDDLQTNYSQSDMQPDLVHGDWATRDESGVTIYADQPRAAAKLDSAELGPRNEQGYHTITDKKGNVVGHMSVIDWGEHLGLQFDPIGGTEYRIGEYGDPDASWNEEEPGVSQDFLNASPRVVKSVLGQLAKQYPNAKTAGGERVTGMGIGHDAIYNLERLRNKTSRESMLQALEEHQQTLNTPELVDDTKIAKDTPRYARGIRPPDGKAPIGQEPLSYDLAPKQARGGLQLLSHYIRPFYGWLDTVATRNNWPELYDAFRGYDNAQVTLNNFQKPYMMKLKEGLGKSSPARQLDFFKWFAADDAAKPKVEAALKITPEELGMLYNTQATVLDPLAEEFGVSLNDYVTKILPKVDAAGGAAKAFPRVKGQNDNFLINKLRSGALDAKNENLLWTAGKYLEFGSRSKFVDPILDSVEDTINEELPEGGYRAGNIKPILDRKLDYLRGVSDYSNQIIKGALEGATELINRGLVRVNAKLPEKMQIDPLDPISNDPLGKFTLFQYAGTLGLKPATVVRDGLQYFITTLPIAGKYAFTGMRKVFPSLRMGSDEARNLWDTASKYGALIERSDLSALYAASDDASTQVGGKKMENFAKWTLGAIQFSHNSNRLAAFWGHTEQVLDALNEYKATGNLKKFNSSSAMWFLDKTERDGFNQEMAEGLHNPQDFAHRVASKLVETSQWNLRRGATPGIYNYSLGRLFGQFGTWPMNYVEYARRFAASEDKQASAKALTLLTLAHGAILAAGQSIGIDSGRWVFTSPGSDWQGGPLFQAAQNIPRSMDFETSEGDTARRELRTMIFPGLLPAGGEAGRLYEALVSDDPNWFVKVLGFHAMENADYERGLHQLLPKE